MRGPRKPAPDDDALATFRVDETPVPAGMGADETPVPPGLGADETPAPPDWREDDRTPAPAGWGENDQPTGDFTPGPGITPALGDTAPTAFRSGGRASGSSGSSHATFRPPAGRQAGPSGEYPILFGKYLLIKELGAGGMGKVFLVRHIKLETERALKTIEPGIASNPDWRLRFSREAKAMARLSHPHIVAVHDADVLPDGEAFIEMEFVRGASLDKRLKPMVPLPIARVDYLLGQLCDALQVAHDMGIVHRDLKPQNLMLQDGAASGEEILKILDFGIAKILDSSDPEDNVTQQGQSLGTPNYMSPEQIGGEPSSVTAVSDIYSIGVILYQLLTGYLPFSGGKNVVLMGHLCNPPPPFAKKNPDAKVPSEVEALVLRCLEKNPKDRPQSARELAEEFHRIAAPPPPPPTQKTLLAGNATQPRARGRELGLVAALAFAVVLAGLALYRNHGGPAPVKFAVTPEPASLEVIAGAEKSKRLHLRVTGATPGVATEVALLFPEKNPDLVIKQEARPFSDVYEYSVSAALNSSPGDERAPLRFDVRSGGKHQELSIPVRIVRPALNLLPSGFAEAPGAKLVRLPSGGIYPDRIVRKVTPDLEVVFLLIPVKPGSDGPNASFYIMENKVWNGLYKAFHHDQPAPAVAAEAAAKALKEQLDTATPEKLTWPVFLVPLQDARAFARWLVPPGTGDLKGDLPTGPQWDKASGFYDRPQGSSLDKAGPFLPSYVPNQPGQIAVRRKDQGPMPVGTAPADISPFNVRDMAGNGREWTRPVSNGLTIVEVRGGKFTDDRPYYFIDYDHLDESPKLGRPYVSFRVVIEGL